MDYSQKLELINMKKERLQKRLSQLTQREKTLASKKRSLNRKNENRRKYNLGGIVVLAMAEVEIEDFDEAEILGALLAVFQNYDLEKHYEFLDAGEKLLLTKRQVEQQSASAQGFTKSEVNIEAVPADDDGGLMALLK